ncbi:MAG: PfkB family carbohydrate kinase [Omnitrophica WOR_2 bacterium]
MENNKIYDIACIGNYTKDTIVSPSGVKFVDGGACNYSAHASACLGLNVAVVTHLSREDERVIDKLQQAGISCFASYTPCSTQIRLEYPTHNVDIRTLYVTSTAGVVRADELEHLNTRAAVIGTSFRGEIDLDVFPMLHGRGVLLAADVQGFVRVLRGDTLIYESWDDMPSVLSHVDILKSDAVEAEFLTGESDLHKAAQFYAKLGPREIVLTHKEGVLFYANGQFYEAGFYPEKMDGRSGRGDTCIGAYVAMRLSKPPFEAGIWAAALTSLKMETLGPFNRTIAEVEDLVQRKYRNGSKNS